MNGLKRTCHMSLNHRFASNIHCSFPSFSPAFSFCCFYQVTIGERNIAFNAAVAQVIFCLGCQSLGQLPNIDTAANHKPSPRNRTHNPRHDQHHDQKIPAPPFQVSRRQAVPNDYSDKRNQKGVNKAVNEKSPRNQTVPTCIFRRNADNGT